MWVLGFATLGCSFRRRARSGGSTAKTALDDASEQAKTLQEQITDGDTKAAETTLAALQQSTSTARANTDGPLWTGLSKLPFIGDSVDAVQVISTSLDDIAQRGIPPVVKVSSSLDADVFKPKNGRFNLAKLQDSHPPSPRPARC